MVRKHPERVISVTTVTPSPPYGFGTKDEKGTLINNENSGTGVLQLPALLHQSITKGIVITTISFSQFIYYILFLLLVSFYFTLLICNR